MVEILAEDGADPSKPLTELHLGRRHAEFKGKVSVLCQRAHKAALANVERLSLYDDQVTLGSRHQRRVRSLLPKPFPLPPTPPCCMALAPPTTTKRVTLPLSLPAHVLVALGMHTVQLTSIRGISLFAVHSNLTELNLGRNQVRTGFRSRPTQLDPPTQPRLRGACPSCTTPLLARPALSQNPKPISDRAPLRRYSTLQLTELPDEFGKLQSLRLVVGEYTATTSCCFLLLLASPARG